MYEFHVENICDVEVETECVLADGSNSDCSQIQPDEEPEYCEVVLEYSYIVTNTRPNPQNIDKIGAEFQWE